MDSGWWTVARNGERRKTNVEKSKRDSLGGSFALSPWPAPWPFFLAHLSLLFPNSLKACYRLTTCIPSFATYDIYWTLVSSTFGALSLISRNRFGGTNFSTAFRLWNWHFFSLLFSFFYFVFVSFYRIFRRIFRFSSQSHSPLPPLPPRSPPAPDHSFDYPAFLAYAKSRGCFVVWTADNRLKGGKFLSTTFGKRTSSFPQKKKRNNNNNDNQNRETK